MDDLRHHHKNVYHNQSESQLESDYEMLNSDQKRIVDNVTGAVCLLPAMFGELAEVVMRALPKAPTVHFVTDSYLEDSIKQDERQRRRSAKTTCISGPLMQLPKDFSAFMMNSSNKTQLLQFVLSQWKQSMLAM